MRSIVLVLLAASPAVFAVPTQIGHQGRILDADGLPAEGLHTLEFALYDAEEEGTVLWSEAHEVDLTNGFYSLVLGADEIDNPLEDELLRDNDLFLELSVDEDEALSPRQAINAVPYSRLADTSTNVSGGVVDASEIRVGGSVVVDGSGSWVGSTPAVDWSEISGVPEDVDTHLTEDEVDAYCADNGYAMASDLAAVATSGSFSDLTDVPEDVDTTLTEDEVDAYCEDNGYAMASDLADVATSGSYDDLTDVPASIADGAVGVNAEHISETGTFTVPSGITSLIVYVTGGGGGGSNGSTTSLDLGSHNHAVSEHSHSGGTHNHGSGEHSHSADAGTSVVWDSCASSSHCGGCYGGYVTTGGGTTTTGSATGITSDATIGATSSTGLTTNDADSPGVSVSHNGGDGGAGGGMSALLSVVADTVCEISIGTGGDVDATGGTTTITCGDSSVECAGGSAGASGGVFGRDGRCTVSGGTSLTEYKASHSAPGGGGAGGNSSGATAGEAGSITLRY